MRTNRAQQCPASTTHSLWRSICQVDWYFPRHPKRRARGTAASYCFLPQLMCRPTPIKPSAPSQVSYVFSSIYLPHIKLWLRICPSQRLPRNLATARSSSLRSISPSELESILLNDRRSQLGASALLMVPFPSRSPRIAASINLFPSP